MSDLEKWKKFLDEMGIDYTVYESAFNNSIVIDESNMYYETGIVSIRFNPKTKEFEGFCTGVL